MTQSNESVFRNLEKNNRAREFVKIPMGLTEKKRNGRANNNLTNIQAQYYERR